MKNEFGIRCRQTPFLYKIQLRETGNAVGKDLPDAARHLADLFATLLEYKKEGCRFPQNDSLYIKRT